MWPALKTNPKPRLKKADEGRVVTIEQLKVGDKLAAAVSLAAGGQVLIEYGEVVDERLLGRLHDLNDMGSELNEIRIY